MDFMGSSHSTEQSGCPSGSPRTPASILHVHGNMPVTVITDCLLFCQSTIKYLQHHGVSRDCKSLNIKMN